MNKQKNKYALIDLRNAANEEEIPENENPDEMINTLENILDFDKRQKGKILKILTSKQMILISPIALEQLQGDNTSENLLNEM